MRKDGGGEGRLAVCKSRFVPQYQKVIIEKTVQFYLCSSKLAQTNDQTSVSRARRARTRLGLYCAFCPERVRVRNAAASLRRGRESPDPAHRPASSRGKRHMECNYLLNLAMFY